ncbi:MAG: hypothetical protein ABIJ59_08450 [Pseudomonadota bacterium]
MNINGIGGAGFSPYQAQAMQGSGRGRPGGRPSDMDVSEMIKTNDTNADGVLAADETGMPDKIFAKADADSDGLLTQQELEDMLAKGTGRPGGMGRPEGISGRPGGMGGMGEIDAQALLDDKDSDEDGTISAEESGLTEELFSNLDTNQDGRISTDEIEQGLTSRSEGAFMGSGMGIMQAKAMSAYQEAVNHYMSNFSADSNMNISSFLGTIA